LTEKPIEKLPIGVGTLAVNSGRIVRHFQIAKRRLADARRISAPVPSASMRQRGGLNAERRFKRQFPGAGDSHFPSFEQSFGPRRAFPRGRRNHKGRGKPPATVQHAKREITNRRWREQERPAAPKS